MFTFSNLKLFSKGEFFALSVISNKRGKMVRLFTVFGVQLCQHIVTCNGLSRYIKLHRYEIITSIRYNKHIVRQTK